MFDKHERKFHSPFISLNQDNTRGKPGYAGITNIYINNCLFQLPKQFNLLIQAHKFSLLWSGRQMLFLFRSQAACIHIMFN